MEIHWMKLLSYLVIRLCPRESDAWLIVSTDHIVRHACIVLCLCADSLSISTSFAHTMDLWGAHFDIQASKFSSKAIHESKFSRWIGCTSIVFEWMRWIVFMVLYMVYCTVSQSRTCICYYNYCLSITEASTYFSYLFFTSLFKNCYCYSLILDI